MLELPADYETAARDRKLIPFIGAGFSKNISVSLPGWSEVMEIVAETLDFEPEILNAQGNHLQIAEYLIIKKKEGIVYNTLSNLFNDKSMTVDASRPHMLLPYVDASAIFTTNWDNWIERAFDSQGIPYTKLVTPRDFYERETITPTPTSGTPLYGGDEVRQLRQQNASTMVVKFHGDFTVHESMVFAESRYYDRMDFEDPLDLYLRSEILGRSVLFIGYSFSDDNIRFIWHKLKKMMSGVAHRDRRESFYVTSSGSPVQREILAASGIQTISLDPADVSGGLTELLEQTLEWQGD